jgi:microsomal dipeptidase-like Zn-dependent dipeptidase
MWLMDLLGALLGFVARPIANGTTRWQRRRQSVAQKQMRRCDLDHIGFGNDLMPFPAGTTPSAWNPPAPGDVPWPDIKYVQPEQMPAFTEGLLKKGYKESDVANILGGNWLRIAKQVWK